MAMNLTKKQFMWLTQQGDCHIEDVFVEKGIPGIYMYTPQGNKFYPIPNDENLMLVTKKLRTHVDGTYEVLKKVVKV